MDLDLGEPDFWYPYPTEYDPRQTDSCEWAFQGNYRVPTGVFPG